MTGNHASTAPIGEAALEIMRQRRGTSFPR